MMPGRPKSEKREMLLKDSVQASARSKRAGRGGSTAGEAVEGWLNAAHQMDPRQMAWPPLTRRRLTAHTHPPRVRGLRSSSCGVGCAQVPILTELE
eukprot:4866831-Prymnesium_polylepis.1